MDTHADKRTDVSSKPIENGRCRVLFNGFDHLNSTYHKRPSLIPKLKAADRWREG